MKIRGWMTGVFLCVCVDCTAQELPPGYAPIQPQTDNQNLFPAQEGAKVGGSAKARGYVSESDYAGLADNATAAGSPGSGDGNEMIPQSVSDAPGSQPGELPPMSRPATMEETQRANYDRARSEMFPLSAEQVRELKKQANQNDNAAYQMPVTPPKSVSGSGTVSLTPGSSPPVIRPFINHESSFVVLDSTGSPWPVENFRVGDPRYFLVTRLDSKQGSAFAIDARVMYAQSNLVLKLAGVPKPIIIDLVSGQSELDESTEVRVRALGPNARIGHQGIAPAVDGRLLPVLDGVPPENSTPLTVSGDGGSTQAWMSSASGRMIVRTPFKIVSPASPVFLSSSDGTHVYEMMPSPQLVGLKDGQFINLTVQGW